MTTEELIAAMGTVQDTLGSLRDGKNPRTAAELCLVSLCSDIGGDSVRQLRARISRLEEQMERGVPVNMNARQVTAPVPEIHDPVEVKDLPEQNEDIPEATEHSDETAPEPNADPVSAPVSDLWPQIRKAALELVPVDARINLEDESRVSGRVEGNLLILETQNAFLMGRFQRPDVMQRLSDAARSVSGKDLRVQVREREEKARETRSLDDLRQFKEVHFISE